MFYPVGNLSLVAELPEGVRLIGIDTGRKTIGLALSDKKRRIASPLIQIRRARHAQTIAQIHEIVKEHRAGGFVIGLPLLMNGTEGASAQSARDFAQNLHEALPLPLAFWDERLSSAAAIRALRQSGASVKTRKRNKDAIAAAYILQGALDHLAHIAHIAERDKIP